MSINVNLSGDEWIHIDGNIFFTEVECLALCDQAPVLQIGTEYYAKLSIEELDNILTNLGWFCGYNGSGLF